MIANIRTGYGAYRERERETGREEGGETKSVGMLQKVNKWLYAVYSPYAQIFQREAAIGL